MADKPDILARIWRKWAALVAITAVLCSLFALALAGWTFLWAASGADQGSTASGQCSQCAATGGGDGAFEGAAASTIASPHAGGGSGLTAPMLGGLFDTRDFPRRWECGRWTAQHGWLHIISDLGVWGAYLLIPITLLFFIRKRGDIPFPHIFLLFSAFILACGSTHLMEAVIFWWPVYRFAGVMKFITALVSWVTLLSVLPIIPKALALRSPAALENEVTRRTSELEAKQVELEDAMYTAEQANHSKSELLANMSHEIRTPMTAILGFADVLEEKDINAEDRSQAISTIRRNGRHLLSVINDILDLSKIESGKLELEHVYCDVANLVEEVASLLRVRADEKQLLLEVEFATRMSNAVMVDPVRLRQVLMNLVGNALKFTEDGAVRIVVRSSEPDKDGKVRIQFEVIDTGIGIAPEQLDELFQPFTQADASTTRRFGGTGLGLTICRQLVAIMGGDIDVQSVVGEGSVFRFWIEAKVTAAAEPVDLRPGRRESIGPPTDGSLNCRILLVEDGKDNQRLIAHVLRRAGAEVDVVENGRLGYEAAVNADRLSRPYDVILMDMQMPEMDGYAATRLLRETGYTRPIIALTAHAMAGDRERCLKAGCDDYQTKPIRREQLIEAIHKQTVRDATAVPVD